ncbi:MAG: polyprenyl diphosphate synthase [Rhodoferax sp.]
MKHRKALSVPPSSLPRHVAIVMDGNGRWASQRFLPRIAGHRQGVEALKRVVRLCAEKGVAELTVFAFSSENWSRPQEEVSGLMDLLVGALGREVENMARDGVRIRFVGARESLSGRIQAGLAQAEARTAHNQRIGLNVCFNYGGRWEIVAAAQALAREGLEISEESISQRLALAPSKDPDLFIRTGGEMRLSNFLLWQAAYAELFFSPALWPDFDEAALDAALAAYAQRERRFGKTSEQLRQTQDRA